MSQDTSYILAAIRDLQDVEEANSEKLDKIIRLLEELNNKTR